MRPRILIVDDDVDILDSLAMLLEERYDVVTALDGAAALDALSSTRIDAMLLDLMMPVMDGAGLKRELDARGVRVPIVIISAGVRVAEQAHELGIPEHLTKPLDPVRLECVLARVLAARGSGGDPANGEAR